jgi:hypothetical protein
VHRRPEHDHAVAEAEEEGDRQDRADAHQDGERHEALAENQPHERSHRP